MASGPSVGAKFVIQFNVEGKGKDDLKKIASLMDDFAESTEKGEKSLKHAGESADELAGKMHGVAHAGEKAHSSFGQMAHMAHASHQLVEAVGHKGHGFIEAGKEGIGVFGELLGEMMHELAPVEQSIIRIMSTGHKTKEEAVHMMHEAANLMGVLPVTESQVSNIVSGLVSANVDMHKSFGKYSELAATGAAAKEVGENFAKMGSNFDKVSTTSMVTDFAAMNGQLEDMDGFVQMFNSVLSTGNVSHLANRVPRDVLQALTKGVKKGGADAGNEMMDNLFDILKKRGAIGAGALATETAHGVMVKFQDLKMSVARAIGMLPGEGGSYDKIVVAFSDIHRKIFATFNDPEFIAAIHDTMQPVIDTLLFGLEAVGDALAYIFNAIKEHPIILKVAAGFLAVGSAISILAGAALALGSAIAGPVITLMLMPELLLIIPAGILAMVAAFGALSFVVVAAAGAAEMFKQNFGGVLDFMQKAQVLGKALTETFQNWGDSSSYMSEETYQALNKMGLVPMFLNIVGWMRKAQQAWSGFKKGFLESWDSIKAKVGGAFGEVSSSVERLMGSLGHMFQSSKTSAKDATGAGENWGKTAGAIVDKIADGVVWLTRGISTFLNGIPDIIRGVSSVKTDVMGVYYITKHVMQQILNLLSLVVNVLNAPFTLFGNFIDYTALKIVQLLNLASKLPGASGLHGEESDEQVAKNVEASKAGMKSAFTDIANPIMAMGKDRDELLSNMAALAKSDDDAQNFAARMEAGAREFDKANPGGTSGARPAPPLPYAPAAPNMSMPALNQSASFPGTAPGAAGVAQKVTNVINLPEQQIVMDGEVVGKVLARRQTLDDERGGGMSVQPPMFSGMAG